MARRPSTTQVTEPPVTRVRIPKGVTTLIVYGGMFDPPHAFHVEAVPKIVRESLGDDVWLLYIPAAKSPLKPHGPVASDAHRIAILRLAVGPQHLWTDECNRARWLRARGRERASYTVDTLRRLKSMLPRGVKLRLLIGSDQAADFHKWKSCRAIVRMASPVVMARAPITTRAELQRAMNAEFWTAAERRAWGERLLSNRVVKASSTQARQQLAKGRSLGRDIPAAIASYIKKHSLYQADK